MNKVEIAHAAMVAQLEKDPTEIIKTLNPTTMSLIHMGIGVSGEAGELLDAIKKYAIYNKPLDRVNVVEELGDLEFYMEGIRARLGISRDTTLVANTDKLLKGKNARYASGSYSNAQAQDRADKKEGIPTLQGMGAAAPVWVEPTPSPLSIEPPTLVKSDYRIDPAFKILILGHGRHGKDTFADLLAKMLHIELKASSLFCAEHVVYPKMLKAKDMDYGYSTWQEAYEDRATRRTNWHCIIQDYNTPDKAKLAKEICAVSSGYIGMRCEHEYAASMAQELFDVVIWVDAKERAPLESPTSFTVVFNPDTMMYVNNNGDEVNLEREALHMARQLSVMSEATYGEWAAGPKEALKKAKPIYSMPPEEEAVTIHPWPILNKEDFERKYLLDEEVQPAKQTQFEQWGAFELPIMTVQEFMYSEAEPNARFQATKKEIMEYVEMEVELALKNRNFGDNGAVE